MISRAVMISLSLLIFFSSVSIAKECIPVLETYLSKSGDTDLSMNDTFNQIMTGMTPLFVYLDVRLDAKQDQDLAKPPDKSGALFFSVVGANSNNEYVLHIGKNAIITWYSHKTRKLTGYWEIYDVIGPYQGSMVVAMRPFTPTLKKCVRETSGPRAYH